MGDVTAVASVIKGGSLQITMDIADDMALTVLLHAIKDFEGVSGWNSRFTWSHLKASDSNFEWVDRTMRKVKQQKGYVGDKVIKLADSIAKACKQVQQYFVEQDKAGKVSKVTADRVSK